MFVRYNGTMGTMSSQNIHIIWIITIKTIVTIETFILMNMDEGQKHAIQLLGMAGIGLLGLWFHGRLPWQRGMAEINMSKCLNFN